MSWCIFGIIHFLFIKWCRNILLTNCSHLVMNGLTFPALSLDMKKDSLALLLGFRFSKSFLLRKCLILSMYWLLLQFLRKGRKSLTQCKPAHGLWKKYFIPKGMLIYLLSLSLKYTKPETLSVFLNINGFLKNHSLRTYMKFQFAALF